MKEKLLKIGKLLNKSYPTWSITIHAGPRVYIDIPSPFIEDSIVQQLIL